MNRKWMSILLCCALVVSFFAALPAPRAMAATCTSEASGNWNDTATWDCGAIPGVADDVVIQFTHQVTLTRNESVNSITIQSAATRLTGAFTLEVNGTLNSNTTTPNASIISGSTTIKFVGSTSRALFGTSWGATTTALLFEVALDSGAPGTVSTNVKAGTITISSGTFDMGTRDLRPDGASSGTGTLTVSSGATLKMGGGSITRTGTASTGYFSTLTVNGTLNYSSTTVGSINTNTINFNGTVEYSASGAQTLVARTSGGGGSANPNTYTNLKLSGSGAKTLSQNTTVNGTLTLAGMASLALSTFTLTYGGSSTLEYAGSASQTTADVEFPASGAPNSLTINNSNGVTLHASRTVNGTLTLTSGLLTLGAYDLTLGSSASVSGMPSASNMVVADNTGKLCKTFGAAGSFTFPIGDNTGTAEYSPVALTVNSGSGLGDFCFRVTDAAPTHKPTGVTNYITRDWVGNTTASGPNYNATFTYLAADVVGTEASMSGKRYGSAPPWQTLGAVVTATHVFTGTDLTEMSEFTAFDTDLAVTLAALDAIPAAGRVTVRWETASEADTLGFNLYRAAAGDDWTRLNAAMIPSLAPGSPFGASYRYDDATAARGATYRYRLAAVGVDSQETPLDSVQVNTPYWLWLPVVGW